MDPYIGWAIGFGFAAVALFALEVFIPSGGLLGILSAAATLGTIICLFMVDATYGWIGLGASLFLVPMALGLAMKIFPHTPIGRRLVLRSDGGPHEVRYSSQKSTDSELMNAEGVATTELRPVGVVSFDGRRVECLAERGVIEPGTRVRVVSINGIEIKVRPI